MRKLFLAAAFAGTMTGAAALAGQGAPGGRGGMMTRADTNGEGKISQAEFTALATARFARLDMNRDGQITPDEMSVRRN